MPTIPTAWSFSSLDMWRQCPLKYRLTKIDKLDKEQSEAMIRGNRIHVALAKYIEGTLETMPVEVKDPYHRGLYEAMRDFDGMKIVEKQWGFNSSWKETGWFAADTWFRAILDVGLFYDDDTFEAVDHKTGKRYGSNDEQVELFSAAVMSRFPKTKVVTTRLVYIDQPNGLEEIADHPAKDREKLVDKWTKAAMPMLGDRVWPARPNDKCTYCPFNKFKGGQCRFG